MHHERSKLRKRCTRVNFFAAFEMIRGRIGASPHDFDLPAENAAEKAAACPGVTTIPASSTGASAAATSAIARRDIGIEAVISAASGAAMIVRPVTAAAYFDRSCRRFQVFRSASGNGKGAPRYECGRQKRGSRYNEFFHVFPEKERNFCGTELP